MTTLGIARKDASQLQALDRIAEQTRQRFKLGREAVVMVSQIVCTLPGCPPLETVVLFWTEAGVRHRFKVFKPATEVVEADIPYAWLLPAIAAPDGYDDDCC